MPGGGMGSSGAGRLINGCLPENSTATSTGRSWPMLLKNAMFGRGNGAAGVQRKWIGS
jgi:hypothetical protein